MTPMIMTSRRSSSSSLFTISSLCLKFLVLTSSLQLNAAVASDSNGAKIWLPGATGSGPYDVANAWATAFAALYPEAELTLSSVGSGAAQKALWGDIDCEKKPVKAVCAQQEVQKTVWGLGDAPIKENLYEEHPTLQLQQFPACAGAIAMVYSKEVLGDAPPGTKLRTTFDVLGGVFNTSIAYWDDPLIQELNPTFALPHEPISKVVREDSSGQTSIVTDALGFQVPTWPEEAVGKQPEWPLGPLAYASDLHALSTTSSATALSCEEMGNETTITTSTNARPYSFHADGKNGISLGLLRVPYSIGYMEMGFFGRLTDFLEQVQIGTKTSQGTFIEANPEALRATMGGLANQLNPKTLELNLAREQTPVGGYPIAGYAYWYLKKIPEAFTDCYQAWLVCKFVEWSYLDPQAADLALANGWVVPPQAVVNKTLERLQDVLCYNAEVTPPVIMPALSYTPPPYRTTQEDEDHTILITVVVVSAVTIIGIALLWGLDQRRKQKRGDDSLWKIQRSEITFADPPEIVGNGKFGVVVLGTYRGCAVACKKVIPPSSSLKSKQNSAGRDSLVLGSQSMKGSLLLHTNSAHNTSATGGYSSSGCYNGGGSAAAGSNSGGGINLGLVSGSLVRGIVAGTMRTFSFESSTSKDQQQTLKVLKRDFAEEMRFLSKLRHPCVTTVMGAVMGDDPMLVMEYMHYGSLWQLLKNETMVLDGDLIVPILRDISSGIRFLHSAELVHGDLKSQNILVDDKFRAKVADLGMSSKSKYGTGTPFWMAPELLRGESMNTAATDVYSFGIILYEVFSRRDPYEDEEPTEVLRLVADKSVRKRPPFPRSMPEKVKSLMGDCLDEIAENRPTFEELDTRLKRIDAESATVSQPGQGRSAQLSLFDIFPPHIAQALQKGQTVEPEHKDCVTIFFSDIVGFTTISQTMEPKEVAGLLDRLYTAFDALSSKHDVFKVETIGDAYMAVTNLVKEQDEDHTKRIAQFAIEAIAAANSIQIDPKDPEKGCVRIRVGFHSGPVVADVVGTRSPRYCLFGDTVNTASRMESNSSVNRINCSRAAAKLLRAQCPAIAIKPRGPIHVKGKGDMRCYWVGEESDHGGGVGDEPTVNDESEVDCGAATPTPSAISALEPLVESSIEFDRQSSLGDLSRDTALSPLNLTVIEEVEQSATDGREYDEGPLAESWHDEEMANLNEDHSSAPPEARPPSPPKKKGSLLRLIDQSQKWLRLNEELVPLDDEISV